MSKIVSLDSPTPRYNTNGVREKRYLGSVSEVLPIPNLVEVQRNSFKYLLEHGLNELLAEFSPIRDQSSHQAERGLDLYLDGFELGTPKYTVEECRDNDRTYSAPLRIRARLLIRKTGEIKERAPIFAGDFPLMTEKGTFIIGGTERAVVTQVMRSPGIYFNGNLDAADGQVQAGALLLPSRGIWLEFETNAQGVMSVKIDRKRRLNLATFLRCFGVSSTDDIRALVADVDTGAVRFMDATLDKDTTTSTEEAYYEFYRRYRPGEPPSVEAGRQLFQALFCQARKYTLSRVGRYKLNRRLDVAVAADNYLLTTEDITATVCKLILLNNGQERPDDFDHLGNRRVRAVGELLQERLRYGMERMERLARSKMSLIEPEEATPDAILSIRPLIAAVREFFQGSQLSQYMDQTNPLSELTHLRRVSALGPGGLNRERAGVEVRDVHFSHYGRICPIETPEGPNIGLIGSLATYARVNDYGFIETPYRVVRHRLASSDPQLVGRTLREPVLDFPSGAVVTAAMASRLQEEGIAEVAVNAFATNDIVYMTADAEGRYKIAQATTPMDAQLQIQAEQVEMRQGSQFTMVSPEQIDLMDISPQQLVSIAADMIPFIEHDDANRALMGANMQRQAVPLLRPSAPLVGTGIEERVARDSGQILISEHKGTIVGVDGRAIVVQDEHGAQHSYAMKKFGRSNQGTCLHQRPIVRVGDQVEVGQPISDSASTDNGEVALGQNLLVAFLPLNGLNYEDAIILSERVVRDDLLTSLHLEEHDCDSRDTKLGPEEITRDLPNVGDDALANLDEEGIIRIGAAVGPGDILVGKITPRSETELSAEERLLRAIFGEKAREVSDTSLKVPHGERGTVINVRLFERGNDRDRENPVQLPASVHRRVRVTIAQTRKAQIGDKLAGRHGNKGVVAAILPVEDMPFLEDGTPVDVVLNPIGVPSRMNVGQLLETHLGFAAAQLNVAFRTPIFAGATESDIRAALQEAGLPEDGKVVLRDGRNGLPYDERVTVGFMYMLKLSHQVEDKVHARSTGPYSLITQQPLGGKAQFGGQRLGEMEVWALEAYGASHILQEMLTIKSDDVVGRVKTYEAILKGEPIPEPGVPESFRVLVKELQALGLNFEALGPDEAALPLDGATDEDVPMRLGPRG